MGRQRTPWQYNQVCRRCRVTRSWNLARVDGPNTIEQSTFWGAPNHCLEASGSGVTIRDSVALNCQDSLFLKNNPLGELTVERNIFHNGVFVTTSNDGRGGWHVPQRWIFRFNLLKSLVVDRWAFLAQESSCNVYAGAGDAFKVIDTNGVRGQTYSHVSAVQFVGQEGGSMTLPVSTWAGWPMLRDFGAHSLRAFNLDEPVQVCGQRAGPQ
jgi:hypothetical protein